MENRQCCLDVVGCGALLLLAAAAGTALAGTAPAAGAGGETVSLQGVLYAPDTAPELISMVPQKFEAGVELAGESVELAGDFASWIVGGVSIGPGETREQVAANCRSGGQPANAECGIRIVRFGQYGMVEDPIALTWLAEVEGVAAGPAGKLVSTLDSEGDLVFPAKVHFDLDLVFTLQRDGESEPVTLRSRTATAFDGTIDDWPLGLSVLELSNGPVSYYREGDLAAADAAPFMIVKSATVALADKPSEFFRVHPQITRAQVVDSTGGAWHKGAVGGVKLEWTDTAEQVTSSHLDHYSVYRSLGDGSTVGGWNRIATVPVAQTTYTDREFGGGEQAAYLVVHDTDFPFGRHYEGLYGKPAVVAPVK